MKGHLRHLFVASTCLCAGTVGAGGAKPGFKGVADFVLTESHQLYLIDASGNVSRSDLPREISARGEPLSYVFALSNAGTESRLLIGCGSRNVIPNTEDLPGFDLFISDFAGKLRLRLTEGHDVIQAVWSPNGEQVAYVTRKLQIFVGQADGSGKRFVANGSTPAWSPDGRKLAYFNLDRPFFGANGFTGGIAEFDPTSEATTVYSQGYDDSQPIYSPRGDSIIFTGSLRTGLASLYRLDLQTRAITQLTNVGRREMDTDFVAVPNGRMLFSEDGRTLAFSTHYGQPEVWTVKFDSAGEQVVGDFKLAQGQLSGLSKDGKTAAILKLDGTPKLIQQTIR
jgi:Tol biopolymer transport system component